ncbi:MAG: hypothetical protein JW804_03145 [Sedimentisphaerales bacterium]|nr:hypothetical protein [Sedimentisphaerales bacterium]
MVRLFRQPSRQASSPQVAQDKNRWINPHISPRCSPGFAKGYAEASRERRGVSNIKTYDKIRKLSTRTVCPDTSGFSGDCMTIYITY